MILRIGSPFLLYTFIISLVESALPYNRNPIASSNDDSVEGSAPLPGHDDDEEISGLATKIAILRVNFLFDSSQWPCDSKKRPIGYFQELLNDGKTIKEFSFQKIQVKRARENCDKLESNNLKLDMILDIYIEEDKKTTVLAKYEHLKNMILEDVLPVIDMTTIFEPNVVRTDFGVNLPFSKTKNTEMEDKSNNFGPNSQTYQETFEKITQFEIWKYECDSTCRTCTRPPLSFIKSIVNSTRILQIPGLQKFQINDVRGCKSDISES